MYFRFYSEVPDEVTAQVVQLAFEVFRPPRFNFKPNLQEAERFFRSHVHNPGYRCLVAEEAGRVAGYSWGYTLEGSVNSYYPMDLLRKELPALGVDERDVHFGGSTAVRTEGIKLGRHLILARTSDSNKPFVATHTSQAAIRHIYGKYFGRPILDVPEESFYEGASFLLYRTQGVPL
jgi:hypothetical protein